MLPREWNVALGMDTTISYSWGKKSTMVARASCFPCSLGSVCLFPYPASEYVCDCDDGPQPSSKGLSSPLNWCPEKWLQVAI